MRAKQAEYRMAINGAELEVVVLYHSCSRSWAIDPCGRSMAPILYRRLAITSGSDGEGTNRYSGYDNDWETINTFSVISGRE